ncbi:serine hydrolase domain-containing protein [Brevundimonas sp.]|uniref:serine hydrolase domain-containing protein n=1 Tax=Brevundimonas sp. TaxID=1871086 RepID=UPI0025F23C05|nr:serine hydrolase domain-containing protein [Brevundimonas sp.]
MRTPSLIALCGAVGAGALLLGIAVGEAVAQREPAPVTEPQVQHIDLEPLTVQPSALPRLRARLDELEARGQFMGVVVVAQGDRLLLREAYGLSDAETGRANAPDDRFRLASISKQFTAAAILRLQDEGRLSVHDPVCRWISPCPQGWEAIRLTNLLSHSSGLPDLMERPGWGDRRVTPASLSELTTDTMRFRPRFEPGTRARYNNAAYNLLADIVERASGRPYETFLREAFFEPLGMDDTGSDADARAEGIVMGHNTGAGGPVHGPLPNVSIIAGAGALYSTADDVLAWQRALHGGRLLSQESYSLMIADHAPADQGLPPGARPRGWGFGLFTGDLGSGADPQFHAPQIYHTGSWAGFRNMVSHMPGEDVTVVVLTNNYHQRDQVFLIVQQAVAEAIGAPFPTGLQQ